MSNPIGNSSNPFWSFHTPPSTSVSPTTPSPSPIDECEPKIIHTVSVDETNEVIIEISTKIIKKNKTE